MKTNCGEAFCINEKSLQTVRTRKLSECGEKDIPKKEEGRKHITQCGMQVKEKTNIRKNASQKFQLSRPRNRHLN
jgi:hypothetical protein